ncbi:hypothetical protein DH2020_027208 [Rehmannia glutinosa]|uniref:Bacterial surface antigen (D15) domain-containing protein n=1 Tax=Rehmannia glutinosa TaxID=99300 RepID=A0ABR0VUQ9_REHGL
MARKTLLRPQYLRHRNSAAAPTHSRRRLNNSKLQNPPNFPLHGLVQSFKGFAAFFFAFIFNSHKAWSDSLCPPAIAKQDNNKAQGWDSHGFQPNLIIQLNKLSGFKNYKISNINFLNPRTRSIVKDAHQLFDGLLGLRSGGIYTKKYLMENLDLLSSSPYFEKIEFDAKTNPDGTVDINIPFKEKVYPKKTMFRCISVGMIPEMKPIEMDPNMTDKEQVEFVRTINKQYRNRIESSKECILPGKLRQEIEWALRQETCLRSSLLRRIVNKIQKWYHDNTYYGARVVNHYPLEFNPLLLNQGGEIIFEVQEGDIRKVEIKFQDKLGNICQGNTNIGVIKRVLPKEAWLKPSTTISFGHRNIKGLNRSFQGEMTLSNLFDPQLDDVDFNFEYTHPYIDGLDNPRNRTFQTTCFNTRKLSPVFRGGPGVDDIPIWIDRKGVKATITEDYSKQSKLTYGLVMEDIKTRDEDGNIAARGDRVSFNGQIRGNGPPTTLSGTGVDRMAFLQANLTRDNTRFVNEAIVGERMCSRFGSTLSFTASTLIVSEIFLITKLLPLADHIPSGYNVGEIGASRSKLEVAAEVRVPVKNAFVYAFAEHGNDMGNSVGLAGNPTKSYMRNGHGSSYGVGIKFRQLRAEYTVDHNTRKGAFFFHFGDRF